MPLLAALDAGVHTYETGCIRQTHFAGKAALASHPIHLTDDADGALLDPAVALVVADVSIDDGGLSDLEAGLDLGLQRRLVGFHRQQVVGAGVAVAGAKVAVVT